MLIYLASVIARDRWCFSTLLWRVAVNGYVRFALIYYTPGCDPERFVQLCVYELLNPRQEIPCKPYYLWPSSRQPVGDLPFRNVDALRSRSLSWQLCCEIIIMVNFLVGTPHLILLKRLTYTTKQMSRNNFYCILGRQATSDTFTSNTFTSRVSPSFRIIKFIHRRLDCGDTWQI